MEIGSAINQAAIEEKMHIAAFGADLRMLQQIIPYLEARKECAKRYMNNRHRLADTQQQEFLTMVEHYNVEIRKIMAL